ncbi:MAG: HEAT repeat domain-containing protein [Phycisphaerae bacterium]|nr:HEAT repeat domain-containing protein [Phycisphaerae bacterium]
MKASPCLCVLVICAVQLTGCNGEDASQEAAVAEVFEEFRDDEGTLMAVTGGGGATFSCSIETVRHYARTIRKRGVDPMDVYKFAAAKAEADVQIQFAYLLLLHENKEYLRYADKNIKKLLARHEFLVWGVVAGKDNAVSEHYREAMIGILKKVDSPYPQILVVRDMLKKGDVKTAITRLLNIRVDVYDWAMCAHEILDDIAEAEKYPLLLPYLDSKSVQGAKATVILVEEPKYHNKVIDYLNAMKKSNDPKLKEAALGAADAIGPIGPAARKKIPELLEMLKDTVVGTRVFAARSLGNIGPAAKDAIPALKKLLEDEDSDVRDAAARGIKKIQGGTTTRPKNE